jgi:hypothetical protein
LSSDVADTNRHQWFVHRAPKFWTLQPLASVLILTLYLTHLCGNEYG